MNLFYKYHKFKVLIETETFCISEFFSFVSVTKTCEQDSELIASKQVLRNSFDGESDSKKSISNSILFKVKFITFHPMLTKISFANICFNATCMNYMA